jgi:hypothetical protein
MSNKIDELLKTIYNIEGKPELNEQYRKLWITVKEEIYKLEHFREAQTGLKKASLFTYNNMFIWNTKDNIVSNKNIYSPFKNNFTKLRTLYNNYIKEINLPTIKHIIVTTEVLLNMLYLYGWNIKRMNNEKFNLLVFINVYFATNEQLLKNNLGKMNKIKNSNTKKINSITLDIIKEFTKITIKSKKLFNYL